MISSIVLMSYFFEKGWRNIPTPRPEERFPWPQARNIPKNRAYRRQPSLDHIHPDGRRILRLPTVRGGRVPAAPEST